MERREFLGLAGGLGAGALSGCIDSLPGGDGDDEEPATEPPTPTPTESAGTPTPDLFETTTAEPTPTPTPEPTPTPTQAPGPDRAEKPEPTYTVAADGSGDYEQLQDAYRVAQHGDVIAVGEGTYTVTPLEQRSSEYEWTKNVAVTGEGADATTVRVTGGDHDEVVFGFGDTEWLRLWDLTFEAAGEMTFSIDAEFECHSVTFDVPTTGWSDGGRGRFVATDSTFTAAPLATSTGRGGSYGITVGSCDVANCEFVNVASIFSPNAVETTFAGGLHVGESPGQTDAEVVRSTIRGLELQSPNAEIVVSESTITQRESDHVAIAGTGAGSVLDSVVEGAVRVPADAPLTRLVGNVFDAGGDVEWYLDGAGAEQTYRNAFIDGDIRIDDGSVSVYSREEELGNYYGAHDGDDEDGDGIIDLPRPIPGDAQLTDQYPLADPDPSQYLE